MCRIPSFRDCPYREILSPVPFTLSHAAAAIPFRRTSLVISALVMGCFAPDFAYFISLTPQGTFGHSLAGVFIQDLPAGLVALWLFHAFVKLPLLFFVPSGIRRRLKNGGATAFSFWPLSRFLLIVFSIFVGIATHIAWDFFVHDYDWPYLHWAFLRRYVHLPIAGGESLIKVLEYGSSLLGLAVLAIWILHWYRTTEPSPAAEPANQPYQRAIVVLVPLLAISGAICRAYAAVGIKFDWRSELHFTIGVLIASIGHFLLGLLLCGILIRAESSRRDPVRSR
jgi:hypothetical protein